MTGKAECCICGKTLPNRFSITGTCEEPGCEAVFCSLHWHNGNRRCRRHGYERNLPRENAMSESPEINTTEKRRRAFADALGALRKLGTGTAALIGKMKKDRSPAAMIAAIDEKLSQNAGRKDEASKAIERLHADILAKKKAYASASKARREILEAELKSLLTAYNAAKRSYKILLENERNMALVKGRLGEVDAYAATPVTEAVVDEAIDSLEDAAEKAEAVADAARDLDKAGKRREREDDAESLWDALGEFDDEPEAGSETDAADLEPGAAEPPSARAVKEPEE